MRLWWAPDPRAVEKPSSGARDEAGAGAVCGCVCGRAGAAATAVGSVRMVSRLMRRCMARASSRVVSTEVQRGCRAVGEAGAEAEGDEEEQPGGLPGRGLAGGLWGPASPPAASARARLAKAWAPKPRGGGGQAAWGWLPCTAEGCSAGSAAAPADAVSPAEDAASDSSVPRAARGAPASPACAVEYGWCHPGAAAGARSGAGGAVFRGTGDAHADCVAPSTANASAPEAAPPSGWWRATETTRPDDATGRDGAP